MIYQVLEIQNTTPKELFEITYSEAAYSQFKASETNSEEQHSSEMKGTNHFRIIGCYLPNIRFAIFISQRRRKSGNLLYFVIKNHSFSDEINE